MDHHGTPKNGSSDGSSVEVATYDRELMLKLRETRASRTRPDNLSTEFNDDDGMFSPSKWLEHHWIKEGIVNKVVTNAKKKPIEKLKAEAEMDGTVLSPQRKGFTAGCRASSPKTGDDAGTDKKTNWRAGNLKGSSNGIDFKPPFQKANLESQRAGRNSGSTLGNWRSTIADRDSMYKSGMGRSKLSGNDREKTHLGHTDEKLPEWLDDGPSSMSDVIELKGFDDDAKNARERRSKLRASKKEAVKEKDQSEVENVVKKSKEKDLGKKDSANMVSISAESLLQTAGQSQKPSVLDYPSMANTVSDLEFAALLGIIDENTQPVKSEAPAPATTGSRLSRFFTKSAESEVAAHAQPNVSSSELRAPHVPTEHQLAASSSIMSRVLPPPPGFSHPQYMMEKCGASSSAASAGGVNLADLEKKMMRGAINLEDLERKMVPGVVTLEALERQIAPPSADNAEDLERKAAPGYRINLAEIEKTYMQGRPNGLESEVERNHASDMMGRRVSVEHMVAPSSSSSSKISKIIPGAMTLEDLEKTYTQTQSNGQSHEQTTPQKVLPGAMKLEDLEKSFVQNRSGKEEKVQEPKQEVPVLPPAGFVPQQPIEGVPPVVPPHYVPPPPGMTPIIPGVLPNHQLNPLAMAAAVHGHSNPATAMQDPKVMSTALNIMANMQMQMNMFAMNPSAQAGPGFPAYIAHMMQQNIAAAAAGMGGLNLHHPTEGAAPRHSNGPNYSAHNDEAPTPQSAKVPNNFLPTSVLRQMNKAGHPNPHSTSARSSTTSSVVGVPPGTAHQPGPAGVPSRTSPSVEGDPRIPPKTRKSPETVRLEPDYVVHSKVQQACSQNGDGELGPNHLNRSALEQQYAMVMNAMNSGLPMGAYRPPAH